MEILPKHLPHEVYAVKVGQSTVVEVHRDSRSLVPPFHLDPLTEFLC